MGCLQAHQFWDFIHYQIDEVNADETEVSDTKLEETTLEEADEMVPQKEPCVTLPHNLSPDQ